MKPGTRRRPSSAHHVPDGRTRRRRGDLGAGRALGRSVIMQSREPVVHAARHAEERAGAMREAHTIGQTAHVALARATEEHGSQMEYRCRRTTQGERYENKPMDAGDTKCRNGKVRSNGWKVG